MINSRHWLLLNCTLWKARVRQSSLGLSLGKIKTTQSIGKAKNFGNRKTHKIFLKTQTKLYNTMCKSFQLKQPLWNMQRCVTLSKVSNAVKATIPNIRNLPNHVSDGDESESEEITGSTCSMTTDFDSDPLKLEKHVSFDTLTTVRLIRSRKDYTPHEILSSWYSEGEEKRIHASCLKQIMMLEKGIELRDKEYCSRGLEYHTKNGSRSRSLNRETAFQIVLDEQDRQFETGEPDFEKIAYMYHQASSSSQLWATLTGLRDWREAEAYYDDTALDYMHGLLAPQKEVKPSILHIPSNPKENHGIRFIHTDIPERGRTDVATAA